MPNRPAGGKKGKKQGEVDSVFEQRLKDLKAQAENLYKALMAEEQRKWQIPSDFTGDLLDIKKLHEPSWDRTQLNTNYDKIMQSPDDAGTTGDCVSVKLQIDYNAGEERQWRHRHATICRCICNAHGRRYGQGRGRVFVAPREEAQELIAAGALPGS
jgi:hypothetical protein